MSRKPNLFVVGAPKCGTSALCTYLGEHPNVLISNPKEPFFWSYEFQQMRERNKMTLMSNYLRLFSKASDQHMYVGEGSTNYLYSKQAIEKILQFNPDARFIAMLRNPVDVVHAFHSELLFAYIEQEPDFETAWRLQEKRAQGNAIPKGCPAPLWLQYAEVARFSVQIERFFALVPEQNRMVILFDEFAADNGFWFSETQRFLGLPEFKKEEFQRVNGAHGHRWPALSRFILDPPTLARPLVDLVRLLARNQEGWVGKLKSRFRKSESRKPMSAGFRNELCDFFRDDVGTLSKLLNRDLSHWVGGSVSGTVNNMPVVFDSPVVQSSQNTTH